MSLLLSLFHPSSSLLSFDLISSHSCVSFISLLTASSSYLYSFIHIFIFSLSHFVSSRLFSFRFFILIVFWLFFYHIFLYLFLSFVLISLLLYCLYVFIFFSFYLSSQSPVAFQTACGPEAFLPLKLKWAGTFSALPQKECWAMRCVPTSKWKCLSVQFWNAPWVLSEPVISHDAPQSSLCTHGNAPFENKNRVPCSYRMHRMPSLPHGQNGFSSSFLRTQRTHYTFLFETLHPCHPKPSV